MRQHDAERMGRAVAQPLRRAIAADVALILDEVRPVTAARRVALMDERSRELVGPITPERVE